ncbi:phosphoribosyltransferase domain-containing protein [Paeniglutamicibacter cryotolerans]|uniref:Orotate phosphoribosyltransferase-like protein n=1 Tax=Paeniglutamicibacter cryotolerans TaxID=670079 RepID=A0A839QT56_9MICC|nr:phosphoribosyltransferase domain-containing protein [Paeniglutamicibacter cryotolerans]MBB2995221.1 orotate phosphoribosyltransferase-like protein [Paeniglutamicibacter cryotolerans]
MNGTIWIGDYVANTLGIGVHTDPTGSLFDARDLIGMALRRNPKRAHLLVSSVLGKHIPTDPGLLIAAGELLGALVARALAPEPDTCSTAAIDDAALAAIAAELGAALRTTTDASGAERIARARELLEPLRRDHPEVATLGYAETATGLGALVAGAIGSYYIHSTRHSGNGTPAFGAFEEEHSHATSHRLLPTDPRPLAQSPTLVLVDDELSTGTTIINTIRELHAIAPRPYYVVAALVDMRTADDRARFERIATELGTRIRVVALARGRVALPDDVLETARQLLDTLPPAGNPHQRPAGAIELIELNAADGSRTIPGNRHGSNRTLPADNRVPAAGSALNDALGGLPADDVVVLGTEEFLHFPLLVADWLNTRGPAAGSVRFSSTTRSPIVAMDRADYAINSALDFTSHDDTVDGPGPRFAYNVSGACGPRTIILMPEPGTDPEKLTGPGSVTEALAGAAERVIVALFPAPEPPPATPPAAEPLRGPAFGSYAASDVGWLLKDLGTLELEAPTARRERDIQSGAAHYCESLPVEYEPTPTYLGLFEQSLTRSAQRVAHAVGVISEIAMAKRDGVPVLVSLARAGTPVGVLMKRWIARNHGIDVPHYTMSVIRGKGLDHNALRYLAATYDPARILFVDGWTGKGAVTQTLVSSLAAFSHDGPGSFNPELAVLADPGHCASIFGSRDDYLVPSACLNSTVSGLVSRTVLNEEWIGEHDFHGGKFYAGLRDADRSTRFIDAVAAHFPEVRETARATAREQLSEPPALTFSGLRAVEAIGTEYGIGNINLIKPGVGETTRVLLRRVPWKVLVNPNALRELGHVLLLAEQRGVEILEVPRLPYSCVGLIRPLTGTATEEA